MADDIKNLVGSWTVRFQQYEWIYTFTEYGTVQWRDPHNGRNGAGTWSMRGRAIFVDWKGSTTKETWNTPISPSQQGGTIDASYAKGAFSAHKDPPRFDGFLPEGQMDAFACWAASFSWFSRVLPDVQTQLQMSIIGSANTSFWTNQGAITMNGLMNFNLPGTFIRRKLSNAASFEAHVKAKIFPLIVGFKSGPLGGHVNVIHAYDTSTKNVTAMEPWFPDPMANASYAPLYEGSTLVGFFHKKTRAPFKFTGIHVTRPLSYYSSKPLEGKFFLGFEASKDDRGL
jgi:hypothetical protein